MESNQKRTQSRKKRAANGERTSKMYSFRADETTIDILKRAENKGRLINDLIKQWWRKKPSELLDEDIDPGEHDVEEYMI